MRRLHGRLTHLVVALAVSVALACCTPAAHAQTVTVLHQFTGGLDGGRPEGWAHARRCG